MTGDSPLNLESDSDAGDQKIADILDRLLAEARSGKAVDIDETLRKHPEFADEVRELWATAMIAENFGQISAVDLDITEDSPGFDSNRPEPPDCDDIPQRIGEYEPIEIIGRGGMGIVYRARQQTLDRTVALKMLLRGALASPSDVARFRAEAESAARLNHPNIVPVYDVGEIGEQPYFTMKFIPGTTLTHRLADGPLPARQAAELLIPICRAVADAHSHGVLHRDLKPSNILIDTEGRPYVSDFGLAKRIAIEPDQKDDRDASASHAAITQSGAIVGTPGYLAPEQAAGNRGQLSPSTDVYSLGAILYAMTTGHPPFQAASPIDTVLMVLEQDPAPPRLLNPAADADLEMIALKCLQKPQDLRYANANALADDLEAYLSNEPISARSSQFTQIISRAFRETHHAAVLENWGLLWMLHSLVLLVLCLVTNGFLLAGVSSRLPYLALWVIGLGIWAGVFWNLRHRAGPITFVERQIAHIWAGSMACSTLLFAVEAILDLPVLELSPILGLVSGVVFLVKAGILSGSFYIQAAALFATALVMAAIPRWGLPNIGIALFGIVSAACFFFPGLKYYRQSRLR